MSKYEVQSCRINSAGPEIWFDEGRTDNIESAKIVLKISRNVNEQLKQKGVEYKSRLLCDGKEIEA